MSKNPGEQYKFEGDSVLVIIYDNLKRIENDLISLSSGENLIKNRLNELMHLCQDYLWSPKVSTQTKIEVIRNMSTKLRELYNSLSSAGLSKETLALSHSIEALLRIRLFSTDILSETEQIMGVADLLADLLITSPYLNEDLPPINPTDIDSLKSIFNSLAISATQYFLVADRLPSIFEKDYNDFMRMSIQQYGKILELLKTRFNPRYTFEAIYDERLIDSSTFLRIISAFCSVFGQLQYVIRSLIENGRYDESSVDLTPIGFKKVYSLLDLIAFGERLTDKIDQFLEFLFEELEKTPYFRGTKDLFYNFPSIKRQRDFSYVNKLVFKNYRDIYAHLNHVDSSDKLEETILHAISLHEQYSRVYDTIDISSSLDEEKHKVLIGELIMLILRSEAALLIADPYRSIDHIRIKWLNYKDFINEPLSAFHVSDFTLYGRVLVYYGLKKKDTLLIKKGLLEIKKAIEMYSLRVREQVSFTILESLIGFALNEYEASEVIDKIKEQIELSKEYFPGEEKGNYYKELIEYVKGLEHTLVFGSSIPLENLKERSEYFNPADTETWIPIDFSVFGGKIKNVKWIPFSLIKDRLFKR